MNGRKKCVSKTEFTSKKNYRCLIRKRILVLETIRGGCHWNLTRMLIETGILLSSYYVRLWTLHARVAPRTEKRELFGHWSWYISTDPIRRPSVLFTGYRGNYFGCSWLTVGRCRRSVHFGVVWSVGDPLGCLGISQESDVRYYLQTKSGIGNPTKYYGVFRLYIEDLKGNVLYILQRRSYWTKCHLK